MNNLAFTIANNEFQFKTLLCKQFANRFHWNDQDTKGSIHSGSLLSDHSYSVIGFQATDSLALNYHPKDADGFVFIINRLTGAKYVQLMTESNTMVDFSPRAVEMYIIPAKKLFSFTFAPGTIGKTTLFYMRCEALKGILSPAIANRMQLQSFFPFSELLNDSLYNEIAAQSDLFYRHNPQMINTNIIVSLRSILKNFDDFTGNAVPVIPMKTQYAAIKSERYATVYRNIA